MPAPSEPEKFSIDQMMERLKNPASEPPTEEGELVTRADGTQAIRVRKRKRRSHQPHKEELQQQRRSRMIQISSAVILVLLVVFTMGIAIIYANSAPFRENLLRMVSQTSGAQVELEQFRVNPTRANAGQLILTWPEGNALHELSMRGVGATITPVSFLGKSLIGEEITASEGILSLTVPQPGKPLRAIAPGDGPMPVRFDRYAISRLQMRVGDPAQPLIQMRETEASFQPVNDNGRPLLLLNRGEISIRGWHKIKLDRSHIEFRGKELDIVGMRLLHENDNRGFLDLSGTVSPYNPDRPSKLDVRLENFLLTGIAGPDMGELISGRIHSVTSLDSNQLSFTPDSDSAASLAVSFSNSPTHAIELGGFPFLTSLARLLEDSWFERPVFEIDATGTLRRNGTEVAFEDLKFEHKGRMMLRGNLAMGADRRLSGQLEVGIAEAMVRAASNRRIDAMAGPAKEGFRWLSLTISGNARNPSDNFLELLDSSKPEPTGADGPPVGAPSFEDLTTPE
jgi:hypothetical protein